MPSGRRRWVGVGGGRGNGLPRLWPGHGQATPRLWLRHVQAVAKPWPGHGQTMVWPRLGHAWPGHGQGACSAQITRNQNKKLKRWRSQAWTPAPREDAISISREAKNAKRQTAPSIQKTQKANNEKGKRLLAGGSGLRVFLHFFHSLFFSCLAFWFFLDVWCCLAFCVFWLPCLLKLHLRAARASTLAIAIA